MTVQPLPPALARKMWRTLEPLHAMIYFVPEANEAYAGLGLVGSSAYFVSRSAPMGAVNAEVVTATFFNFEPELVNRAMAHAWATTSPSAVLAARLDAVDRALRRLLGTAIGEPPLLEAADLARRAAEACVAAGRPLFAGHASLEWPQTPHLVLWHALTMLREYRGDGHIAALVSAGLSGIEALITHAATGEASRNVLQRSRGWSDRDWHTGEQELTERGWLTPEADLTGLGREQRQHIEDQTDELAMAPWSRLGPEACERLRTLGRPLSKAVVAAGTFAAAVPWFT